MRYRNHKPFTVCAVLGSMALSILTHDRMSAAEIALPPETARYKESVLPGYALTTSMCMTCHSADYTRMQPPNLLRPYWKATVIKMQKTFGAPIPDGKVDAIVDYLVKLYGADQLSNPAMPVRKGSETIPPPR